MELSGKCRMIFLVVIEQSTVKQFLSGCMGGYVDGLSKCRGTFLGCDGTSLGRHWTFPGLIGQASVK